MACDVFHQGFDTMSFRGVLTCLYLVVAAVAGSAGARAQEIKVVATSKPVHSLVAGVMLGTGTPDLLVDGNASPHSFAMRPSDAQKVNKADVFFRVSEALEPFTGRVVKALPRSVKVVTLAEAAGVKLLLRRAGGPFETHNGGHGHGHSGHKHAVAASNYDAHVWLDPDNARAMVAQIVAALSAVSPAHAASYEANAAQINARLDALSAAVAKDLSGVAHRPFVVLHDAYQYFERRFGLAAIGSILVDPDEQPSAKRITDLRRRLGQSSAVCVFAEPNHQPKVVTSVVEGTSARTAVLDPEGTMLDAGPGLYFELMQKLAGAMKSCLD